jgi:hypothetical protein
MTLVLPLALSAPGAALIGAAAAAVVNVLGFAMLGIRQERQRRREFYGHALETTLAYREFAYAVPRRRPDAAAEERVRLSEAMREVQRDLAKCESFMRIERAGAVAGTYRQLVAQTRSIAGGYIRQASIDPPVEEDHQMNVPGGLDFSALDKFEQAFLDAVAQDLAWYRFWR